MPHVILSHILVPVFPQNGFLENQVRASEGNRTDPAGPILNIPVTSTKADVANLLQQVQSKFIF